MKEVQQAEFNFESYKITELTYREPGLEKVGLQITFEPSGIYFSQKGEFFIKINFSASYAVEDKKDELVLSAVIEALFKFKSAIAFGEIPPYFYRNAIAIVFPYIRAFISTLTGSTGVRPLVLPIMNLSALDELLKQSTTEEK